MPKPTRLLKLLYFTIKNRILRTINHWPFYTKYQLHFFELLEAMQRSWNHWRLSLSLDILQESEFASKEDLLLISALDVGFIFFSNGVLAVSNGSLNCRLQLFHGAITCRRSHRWSCNEKATICWGCPHGCWCWEFSSSSSQFLPVSRIQITWKRISLSTYVQVLFPPSEEQWPDHSCISF